MLIAAFAATVLAVMLGLWLSALWMIREAPPKTIPVTAMIHGSAGAGAVILLLLALQGPRRGVHTGAANFGWTAFGLMAAALAGGATILSFHLRRRGAPSALIALHGMLGFAGGIMLAAWFAAPAGVRP